MIDVLTQKLCQTYKSAEDEFIVAVLAPTGLAAFNVNGQTIHRFFKLPVDNFYSKKNKIRKVFNKDDLKMMRIILKNLKLIIIGEIF